MVGWKAWVAGYIVEISAIFFLQNGERKPLSFNPRHDGVWLATRPDGGGGGQRGP